jgi:hypothetical protein
MAAERPQAQPGCPAVMVSARQTGARMERTPSKGRRHASASKVTSAGSTNSVVPDRGSARRILRAEYKRDSEVWAKAASVAKRASTWAEASRVAARDGNASAARRAAEELANITGRMSALLSRAIAHGDRSRRAALDRGLMFVDAWWRQTTAIEVAQRAVSGGESLAEMTESLASMVNQSIAQAADSLALADELIHEMAVKREARRAAGQKGGLSRAQHDSRKRASILKAFRRTGGKLERGVASRIAKQVGTSPQYALRVIKADLSAKKRNIPNE